MVTERDLGDFVPKDLTCSKQGFEQSCRVNKLLGYIRRNTGLTLGDRSIRRSVYLTLFRPLFGYATQIWAPQSIELIVQFRVLYNR